MAMSRTSTIKRDCPRIAAAVIAALPVLAHAQQAPAVAASAAELQILRAQLESMRFFHDSFVSMAQWTLGTAVTVVITVAFYSWFTSKSNYERDRELLKAQAQSLKDELTSLVLQKTAEARQESDASLTKRQAEIQKSVDTALQGRLVAVKEVAREARDVALELKAKSELSEAKRAQKEGNYDWAIYKYCEALNIFVKRETDFYEASDALDEINEPVRNFVCEA